MPDALAKLIEQADRAQDRYAGFHGSFISVFMRSLSISQSASHLARKAMTIISRTGQFILQELRYTLR
jgi:hypothetical protein